jgi:hypothetical protein
MGSSSKSFALILILLIVVPSLMLIKTANAQTIPKSSVPEFTVTLISSSPESHFVNKTIELSIKNQPSVSFYNVRMRVKDGNWSLLYPNNNSVPTQSNGEYTILSYSSGFLGVEYQYNLGYTSQNLSAGDKVDFQVQAMIGSIHRVFNPNATNQLEMYPYVFTGQMSDWSNTQTITMAESNTSPTPAVPEFPFIAIPLLLFLLSVVAVLSLKKKRITKNVL